MANVVNWSERDEPYASGWRDCTYSAYLMGLIYAGYATFPLGIYTINEREAFERSDDKPDETGGNMFYCDQGSSRRYGRTLDTPTISLSDALKTPGIGLVLSGVNGNLPYGHWLRRWDPGFIGNHAVFVIPMGNGNVLWFDPEAPWKFAGDTVDNATVLKWASLSVSTPSNWRIAVADKWAPAATTVTLKYGGYEGYRGTWKVNSDGSRFRSSPYLRSDNIIGTVNAGYTFSNAQTTDTGDYVNGSRRWLGDETGNKWMHSSLVTLVR